MILPKRIILVSETRHSWVSHGPVSETRTQNINKLQYYLPRDNDIYTLHKEIAIAAEQKGVEVQFIRLSDGKDLLSHINSALEEPFIVWCISDGQELFRGGYIYSLAKLLKIPYFGSSTGAQAICSNKYISALSLRHANLNIPWSCLLEGNQTLSCCSNKIPEGPYFVRPNNLGSQIGINKESLVHTWKQAVERCVSIKEEFNTASIVQTYVENQAVRVSYVETDAKASIGLNSVNFLSENGAKKSYPMDSTECHTHWEFCYKKPDAISKGLQKQLDKTCNAVKKFLNVKDYFGLDAGIDKNGKLHVFEVNTKPYVNNIFQSHVEYIGYSTVGECFFDALLKSFCRQYAESRWYSRYLNSLTD